MPRKKKVTVHGKKRACRMPTCALYGKHMYTRDLALHLIQEHKMNMGAHDILKECSEDAYKKNKSDMKYRNARKCDYPHCPKRGTIFGRLDKHLKVAHGLTVRQYEEQMKMYKAVHSYIRDNPFIPLDQSTKIECFCQAMEEKRPDTQIDVAALKTDLLGTESYPKKRLRKIQMEARLISFFDTNKEVKINCQEDSEIVMTFNIRKVVMSQGHENVYLKSLFWPEEGLLRMKLKGGEVGYIKQLESELGRPKLELKLTDWIAWVCKDPLYKCFLCCKWHQLELMHKPLCSPEDLHVWDKNNKPTVVYSDHQHGTSYEATLC